MYVVKICVFISEMKQKINNKIKNKNKTSITLVHMHQCQQTPSTNQRLEAWIINEGEGPRSIAF